MTVSVTHSTVATLPDQAGAEINKAEWNAAHTVTGLATVAGTGAYSDLTGIPSTFLVADGNKGDITVSGTGTAWAVNSAAITYAKIQNVTATSRFLGRKTAAAGVVEELTASDAKTILAIAQADVSGLTTSDAPSFARMVSTVAIGTAPLTVTSTTRVANLNVATAGNADTVTTNANLTGPITSSGNATSVTSQTGSGTKFVMDTTPTLVTPVLGAATGTSVTLSGLVQAATFRTASGGLCVMTDAAGGVGAKVGYAAFGGSNRGALQIFSGPAGAPTGNVLLWAEAAGTLGLADSANAQTYHVYGTFTDTSNYVRATLAATSTTVTLAAESAGTGAANIDLTLTPKGTGVVATPVVSTMTAPGSFSMATETGMVLVRRLKLTSTQRATLAGTARVVIH